MSGVSITGSQVGGACRAGRLIGLSHSGTRLVLPAPADNLIVNGGFETGDLTGWTVLSGGWQVLNPQNSSYITNAHGGTHWLICNSPGSSIRSEFFDVAPGTTLEVTLWKADAGELRSHKASLLLPDGGSQDIITMPRIDHADLCKWLPFTATWTVPETVASIALCITNIENGWGRFDDVSVRQII